MEEEVLQETPKQRKARLHKIWARANREHRNRYAKIWREKHPEKCEEIRKRAKAYYYDPVNRERIKVKAKEYTERTKEQRFYSSLKRNFGLSREQYDNLLIRQNNACAICFRVPDKLLVDHEHATGKKKEHGRVRGLLCNNCNIALGHAKDNKDILKNMISYLEKHEIFSI